VVAGKRYTFSVQLGPAPFEVSCITSIKAGSRII
jgi:hypothetical protein